MSDALKHECGVAMLRLRKPLEFYKEKYGTSFYALKKMYLLMEKQRNRGQDGAGLANIKFDVAPGTRYISRYRSVKSQPIKDIFSYINKRFEILHKNDPEKLIDVDYLILSNTLNHCWGHNNELMMNWKFQDIMYERKDPSLNRLYDMGITMYWATVVYFRKTEYVESFFNIVKHVKNNPQYYKDLYKWQGTLYRNDYSFSIAAHMMSGFVDKGIPQLPTTLYKSFDTDDIHSAVDKNTIVMYLEKPRSPGDFMLTKWQGIDLHIMNKWAINRVSDNLLAYAK